MLFNLISKTNTTGLRILVQNKSSLASADVAKAVKAINKQLDRDVFPAWGLAAQIYTTLKTPDATMVLADGTSNDYLGYHDRDGNGLPIGVVLVKLAESLGDPWSSVLSHEVLEMVGDAEANLTAIGPVPGGSRSVFHWFELCDAVQNDLYTIDGVSVSDFVKPLYFTPEAEGSSLSGSFLDPKLRSFSIAPGGYVGYIDPKDLQNHTAFADARGAERHAIRQQFLVGRGANWRSVHGF